MSKKGMNQKEYKNYYGVSKMKTGGLKGKQKKLDKNNNGRIDAQDFKILQGSKKGMRMGGAVDRGMGLQDESMKPGKIMKARVGGLSRQRLESISNYRNKQAKMKKEKQKEENIRKTEISPMGARKGKMIKANKGKAVKKAMEFASRMANPGVAAIKDVGKLYKKFKDMQERKKNEKDAEVVEAKKGKMIRAKKGKYI